MEGAQLRIMGYVCHFTRIELPPAAARACSVSRPGLMQHKSFFQFTPQRQAKKDPHRYEPPAYIQPNASQAQLFGSSKLSVNSRIPEQSNRHQLHRIGSRVVFQTSSRQCSFLKMCVASFRDDCGFSLKQAPNSQRTIRGETPIRTTAGGSCSCWAQPVREQEFPDDKPTRFSS